MPQDANTRSASAAARGVRPRDNDGSADPAGMAGRASELFEALRASNPNVDQKELFIGTNYQERQRKFLQEKSQQRVMERLERRADMGVPMAFYGRQRSGFALVEAGAAEATGNRISTDRRNVDDRSSFDRRNGDKLRRSNERQQASHEAQRNSRDLPRTSQDLQQQQQQQQRRSGEDQQRNHEEQRRSGEWQRGSCDSGADTTSRPPQPHAGVDDSESSWTVTHGRRRITAPPPMPTTMKPLSTASHGPEPPNNSSTSGLAASSSSTGLPVWTAMSAPASRSIDADVTGNTRGTVLPITGIQPSLEAGSSSPPPAEAAPVPPGIAPSANPISSKGSRLALLTTITEDDLLAATTTLGAVEVASPVPRVAAGEGNSAESGNVDGGVRAGVGNPAVDASESAWRHGSGAHQLFPPSSMQWMLPSLYGSAPAVGDAAGGNSGPAEHMAALRSGPRALEHGGGEAFEAGEGPGAGTLVPQALPKNGSALASGSGSVPPSALTTLGLVEVQPLSDHIQRDDEGSSRQAGISLGGNGGEEGRRGAEIDGGQQQRTGSNRTLSSGPTMTYDDVSDLQQYSRLRQWAIRLCTNPDFEMVVTSIIFGNCVTLCMFDPRHTAHDGLNGKLFWAELSFNICFSIECGLRVVSMGSPLAYIRRPWNQFDFSMVVAGYTVFIPGSSSAMNAIRALRALRPLRTITRFESLRGVIVCFLEAIPLLSSVGGLLLFFIFIYAVAAVQLFPKSYHWTCLDSNAVPFSNGDDPDMFGCGGSGKCPADYTCKLLDKQSAVNVAGFDNTGLAMLSVWQALTLTGWVFMMYRTVDAYSLVAVVYFLTLVFIGAYFVLNLFLAVLKIKFAKAQTLFHNQLALQRSKARRNSIMTFMSKVQSKWSEYSSKRSQASLLNTKLSSAISSKMSSANSGPPSPRMSGGEIMEFNESDFGFASNDRNQLAVPGSSVPLPLGKDEDRPQLGTSQHPVRGDLLPQQLVRVERGTSELDWDVAAAGGMDSRRVDEGSQSWGSGVKDTAPLQQPQPLAPVSSLCSDDVAAFPVSCGVSGKASTASPLALASPVAGGMLSSLSHRQSGLVTDDMESECSQPASRAGSGTLRKLSTTDKRARMAVMKSMEDSPRSMVRVGTLDDLQSSSITSATGSRPPARPALVSIKSPVGRASSRTSRAVSFRRRELDVAPLARAAGVAEALEDDAGSLVGSRVSARLQSSRALSVTRGVGSSDSPPSHPGASPSSLRPHRWQWHILLRRILPSNTLPAEDGDDGTSIWGGSGAEEVLRPPQPSRCSPTKGPVAPHSSPVAKKSRMSSSCTQPTSIKMTNSRTVTSSTDADTARDVRGGGSSASLNPGPVAEAVRFAGGEDGCGALEGDESTWAATAASVGTAGAGAGGAGSMTGPASRENSNAQTPFRTSFQITEAIVSNDDVSHSPCAAAGAMTLAAAMPPRTVSHEAGCKEVPAGRPCRPMSSGVGATGMSGGNDSSLRDSMKSSAEGRGGLMSPGGAERTFSAAPSSMGGTNMAMIVMTAAEFDEFVCDHPFFQRQVLRLQYRTRIFVNHMLFNQAFMLLIFINTVLLAVEYDKQPESLTYFLTVSNYVLTGLFTSEMVVKLFGLGFWDYIRDAFNIFDALVVTISLVEIILATVAGLNVARALRVLKALRVLRLFKLFRYMQSLRRIGEVLLSAFTSFAAIATLLMLFWLVFSIIGMHVFGAKDLDIYEWPNFSTFLYSLITMWNVLNLENWSNIMYATVRVTDWGSSMFFVMWIIIGRYIFLTLFLAVTLEAFEAKYDVNAVRKGAKGGGLSSVLGSILSRASSLGSGISSRANSIMSSIRSNSVRGSCDGDYRDLHDNKIKDKDTLRRRKGPGSGHQTPPDTAGVCGGGAGAPGQVHKPSLCDDTSPLPPGIGYLEDAQAAAVAKYGESTAEHRVNFQKMYTIKQWIDTGSMDLSKVTGPVGSEPTTRYRPLGSSGGGADLPPVTLAAAATVDVGGGAAAGSETEPGDMTGSGNWLPSALLRGLLSNGSSGGAGHGGVGDGCGGKEGGSNGEDTLMPSSGVGRASRSGVPYVDDSAAQSRTSSEKAIEAATVALVGSGSSVSPGQRSLGEGLEMEPFGQSDGTLLRLQQHQLTPQPQPLTGRRVSRTSGTSLGVTRPLTAGPSGGAASAKPSLQSLTLAVRRDLDVVSHGSGNAEPAVDDIVTGARGSPTAASGSSWARPPAAAVAINCVSLPDSSGALGGSELILSRSHGRSRLMRSTTSIDSAAAAGCVVFPTKYSFTAESSNEDCGMLATAPDLSVPISSPQFAPSPTMDAFPAAAATVSLASRSASAALVDPLATAPGDLIPSSVLVAPAAPRSQPPLQLDPQPQPRCGDATRLEAECTPTSVKAIDGDDDDGIRHRDLVDSSLDLVRNAVSAADAATCPSSGSGGGSAAHLMMPAAHPSAGQVIMATFQDMLVQDNDSQSPPDRDLAQTHNPVQLSRLLDPKSGVGSGGSASRDNVQQELLSSLAGNSTALLAMADKLDRTPTIISGSNVLGGGGESSFMPRAGGFVPTELSDGRSAGGALELDSAMFTPRGLAAPPNRLALLLSSCNKDVDIGEVRNGDSDIRNAGSEGVGVLQGLQDSACINFGVTSGHAPSVPAVPLTAAVASTKHIEDASGGYAGLPQSSAEAWEASWQQHDQQRRRSGTAKAAKVALRGDSAERGAFGILAVGSLPSTDVAASGSLHGRKHVAAGDDGLSAAANMSRRGHSGDGGDTLVDVVAGGENGGGSRQLSWLSPGQTGDAKAVRPMTGGDLDVNHDDSRFPATRHRVSEAGSLVQSDVLSRCDSFDSHISGNSHLSGGSNEEGRDGESGHARKRRFRKRRRASILIEGTGKSFWIWDEDHAAREWAYWLVTHKRFDYTMFALIVLNCVGMTLEHPYIRAGSPLDKALYWSNVGFTILFTIEAVVKMFAYTFVAYIKRITNQVDFVIVMTSLLEIILTAVTSSVGAVSALRALRAIKPLRLLTRSAGMRLVFKSVTMSLMSMANVSIVCILFFLIFAILGVQLFAGKFYRCNDNSVSGKAECVGDFTDPRTNTTVGRRWRNEFPNFDNTGNALLCCFITATLNGYTEIMINAMSAPTEEDRQPKEFLNPGAFFWFFGFIVVCTFTLLNLYVGVIFSQFSKIRMLSETGSAFLTSDQNEWAELTKMVFRLKPPDKAQTPESRVRRFIHVMVHTKSFDMFVLTIIFINVGFLTATWYHEPESYTRQKHVADYVFVAFFAAEAAAKIFATGWMAYIKNAWNKLDFLLLLLGLIEIIISILNSNFLRILRIFRIIRLIALVRVAHVAQLVHSVKGIQSLFSTLIYSLPAFGNVGALIGLFFFMYAYVGTFLFGKVQDGFSLSRHVNFHNFWQALLVLTRVATGDNWTEIMFDCMVQPPHCKRSEGRCGTYLAVPYFLTFVLLIYVILLNLFTAVIIETFEKTHEQEEWKLSPQALDDFVTLWSEYDDGSGTILPRNLEELLLKLDPPLGLGPYADNKDVLRFVYDLDIPLVNGRVPFHKTAFELVKRCSQATMPEGAIKEQIDGLVKKFFRELPTRDDMLNFSVAITVMKVQRKWRTRMRAAKLLRKKQWRQLRHDAPSYPELCSSKALLADKFEAYREAQRIAAKAWEADQLTNYNRKLDKAEVARRIEPRWRFNAKYAPAALVAATSEKSAGGLLGLGRRVNVNKLVGGLLRVGNLLGGGSNTGGFTGENVLARSPQVTLSGDQLTAMWASPVAPGSAGGGGGVPDTGATNPLPRLLLRAIGQGTSRPTSCSPTGGRLAGGAQSTPALTLSVVPPELGPVGCIRRRLGSGGRLSANGGAADSPEGFGQRMSPFGELTLSPTASRRPPGMLSNDGGMGGSNTNLPGGASRGIW